MGAAPSKPRTSWFFNDPESRERDFTAEYRIRARCVSGNPIPELKGVVVIGPQVDGWQQLTITGLTELLALTEHWDCPVTIAPPEKGVEFWTLELEDGPHAELLQ